MPRVETWGSENEEEIAGYRNHFNSRRTQHHASIDTRGNNGPLWCHNIASGWPMCRWRHNRPSAVNFEWYRHPGAVKCGFTSVKAKGKESCKWLVHRIPWTSIVRYVSWKKRQAPRFQRRSIADNGIFRNYNTGRRLFSRTRQNLAADACL